MPFTPIHMGPGLLIKSMLQGGFSLMVFGWAQIVMDIQPLVVLLRGHGHVHGFTHTLAGATLLGVAAAVTGKYLAQWGLALIGARALLPLRWPVAVASAFIGTYSHVALDAVMHADLLPFMPISAANPLLGSLSLLTLHQVCMVAGVIGSILYFVVAAFVNDRREARTSRQPVADRSGPSASG